MLNLYLVKNSDKSLEDIKTHVNQESTKKEIKHKKHRYYSQFTKELKIKDTQVSGVPNLSAIKIVEVIDFKGDEYFEDDMLEVVETNSKPNLFTQRNVSSLPLSQNNMRFTVVSRRILSNISDHKKIFDELMQLWDAEIKGNSQDNLIFKNSTRGNFLEDSIVRNIIRKLGGGEIQILPAKMSSSSDPLNILNIKQELLIDDNNNDFNRSFILTTGARLDTPDSGDHYVAVNIRRIGNNIYFTVSDSLRNNNINSEIMECLQSMIEQINSYRSSNGLSQFKFNILNLSSENLNKHKKVIM